MAKRTKNLPTDNTVAVPPTSLEEQLEGFQPWHEVAADKSLEFFDLLRALPPGAWDELMIYLYRLEPQIAKSNDKDKKYIERYTGPIDEKTVKDQFGGGKYLAYLKADTITIREHKFSIDGPAIIQEGQVLTGKSAAAAAGATTLSSEEGIARIVGEVIRATKGDPSAANAGMEVMKKAFTDGLELQKTITAGQIGSMSGNPLVDKVISRVLEKLGDEKPPAGSSLSETLTLVREVAKILRPEGSTQNPTTSVTEQFTIVKELLGVDTLKEIFDMSRPDAKSTPWYVTLITSAIEKLPTIMTEFSRMQQEGFQRALTAHQLVGGRPVMPPVINATPPQPTAPAAQVPAGEISQQVIQAIVDDICRAYDEGYDGEMAAAHLRLSYPQIIETLKPMLANTAQLSAFVATVPQLAERAREPEWAEFQAEFILELRNEPEPAAMPPVVMPPPAPAAIETHDVAGVTTAPPKKSSMPAKKKVNGSGAA